MNNTDWYNNRKWNASIEKSFFDKLSRVRSSKYQYLYLQASVLADKYPAKSLELFDIYFKERTDNFFDAPALASKASAYISLNKIDLAITAFEESLESLSKHGGINPSVDLHYPFFVASRGLKKHYSRVLSILQKINSEPTLMWGKFKYYAALAIILSEDIDYDNDTLLFINNAIWASEQQTSGMSYHKKVGLVVFGKHSKIIRQLKSIRKNISKRKVSLTPKTISLRQKKPAVTEEDIQLENNRKIIDADWQMIVKALGKVGFDITDFCDLDIKYPGIKQEKAILELLLLVEREYSSSIKEAIYRHITCADWLKGKVLIDIIDILFKHFENDNMLFTQLPDQSIDFHLSLSGYKGAKSWNEIHTISVRWEIGFALNSRINHTLVSHKKYQDKLRALIKNKKYRKGRSELILVYSKMAKDKAIPDLIELLDGWDRDVLGNTIRALGVLKNKDAKPHLEKLLKHEDSYFRDLAKRALKKIDSKNSS